MKKIVFLHRWLGVVACVAVLMFAGSGVLHPVMSRFQPKPVQFTPPPLSFTAQPLALRQVLVRHGIDTFVAASVAALPDGAAYRIHTNELAGQRAVRYFDTRSGAEIADGEQLHARYLANYFVGNKFAGERFAGETRATISRIEKIEHFDDEYVFVNRLLPVWRVQFERSDGITAYVDTAGNRLATLNDNSKRIFQNYFRALHNFDFFATQPTLRLIVMLLLLTATVATAIAGVVMSVRLKRASQRLAQRPLRRWHRRLALAISVSTFSFAVSGSWHLLHSQRDVAAITPMHTSFRSDELGDIAIAKPFVLVRIDGVPCFRVAAPQRAGMMHDHQEHHHPVEAVKTMPALNVECIDTHSGAAVANAETRLAEQLARNYSGNATAAAILEAVTTFSGEYGFLNKRLPVWKVQFAGGDARWYVETSSGALALRADAADAAEGTAFSLLHKARFIGDDYKNLRDGLLMVFALGNIVVALLGLWLFVRQLRSRH